MKRKERPSRPKKTQHDKFVELAREVGADESESAFVDKLRQIAKSGVTELRETWEMVGGKMVAGGDAAKIDALLAHRLEKMSADVSGWRTVYRDRETGQMWELSYPASEMHGGGPRLLRRLG